MKAWHVIAVLVAVPTVLGAMMPSEPSRLDRLSPQVSAQRQVRALLRDPDSATFRHLAPGRCGYVNARNGLGGMSGYQRFIITAGGPVLEAQADADSFARVWAASCHL